MPNVRRNLALLAAAGALLVQGSGCVPHPGTLSSSQISRELRSRGLDPAEIVVPYEVSDEMRQWVHTIVPDETPMDKRLEALLNGLVDSDKLKVQYEPRYTATAEEVFRTRRANCLAFTSLFVGLSREIGVPAFFLEVDDIEKFEKEGDLVVVSGHVSAGYGSGPEVRILDFSAYAQPTYRRVRQISDMRAIALFHSNRGGELLRTGRHQEALPWLTKAVA
ncbi:MAG: transglutaminase-like domain-containing protein, partial [Acidobacteriota bacterium]